MFLYRAVSLLSLLFLTGFVSIRAADKPAKDDSPQTIVYDVTNLIHKPGGRTGLDRIDEVARLIVSSVNEGGWGGETEGASRLRDLNGTKLEIHTTTKYHKEIADLLLSLGRLNDMDVNFRADLFEIDRAIFEKEIKPNLNRRPAAAVAGAVVELVKKKGSLILTNTMAVANGREARLISMRQAFTFIEKAQPGEKKQTNEHGVGFQGITICVKPTISADRREIYLQIVQKTTELIELKRQTRQMAFGEDAKDVTVEVPELVEATTTATPTVDDGSLVLASVAYRSPSAKAKDRVLVLVLGPVIYISDEDKERFRNNPK